VGINLM